MSTGITNLSQEIVNLVASYLELCDGSRTLLPIYATISRSWQYAIETQTFREVNLKSTEIDYFSRVIHKHRQRPLKRINFDVVLPTYTDKACTKFETERDKQLNNKVFTKAIKDVLGLLRSWHSEPQAIENNGGPPGKQSLCFCIRDCQSPKDYRWQGWEQIRYGGRHDLLKHRYESSLLQLESIEDVQDVPQVISFYKSQNPRQIEPRSLAMIASKFSCLECFRWRIKDNEKRDPRLRQQTRLAIIVDFAQAFSMIPHSLLRQIGLYVLNNPPNNQEINPSSALMPALPATDHLSLAIHAISQSENVTHLDLDGKVVISPSLFWPATQAKIPSWPNLVSIKVFFSMNTADGEWYFTRDENANPDSDDDPDNVESDLSSTEDYEADDATEQSPDPEIPDAYHEKKVALATGAAPIRNFRSKADPEKLNPLFKAAAQAAGEMPRLQRMSLTTRVEASTAFTFASNYFASGERTARGAGSRNVDMPRLEWVIGRSGYEPEESTMDIWRQAKGQIVQSVVEQ